MNVDDDLLGCEDAIAILSLPDKEEGLVSPKFVVQYDHELRSEWNLYDPLGKVHLVSYERNSENPFLCKGLMEIRKYYSLEGSCWCLLKYKGFSNFDLFIYSEDIVEICYLPPPPPSVLIPRLAAGSTTALSQAITINKEIREEPTWISYPCFFTCKLSKNQTMASQMTLPHHVYEYLRQGEVYDWLLRGPTGLQFECKILGVPLRRYARFGRGWRAFCVAHKLQPGDMLTFSFTSENFAVVDVAKHPIF